MAKFKVGDYVYGAYYYSDKVTGWPKIRAAEGRLISFDDQKATIYGVDPTSWFGRQTIFVNHVGKVFDNKYDRDKEFKF